MQFSHPAVVNTCQKQYITINKIHSSDDFGRCSHLCGWMFIRTINAEMTGASESNVKVRIHRAKEKLSVLLQDLR